MGILVSNRRSMKIKRKEVDNRGTILYYSRIVLCWITNRGYCIAYKKQ